MGWDDGGLKPPPESSVGRGRAAKLVTVEMKVDVLVEVAPRVSCGIGGSLFVPVTSERSIMC